MDVHDSTQTGPGGGFKNYLLVRGSHMMSPTEKLMEYAGLSAPNQEITYEFKVGKIGDWTAIEFPGQESPWMFRNIVFWFLGYDDDSNYADEVVGISLPTVPELNGYLVYGNNAEDRPIDSLYYRTHDGQCFVVYVPFDEFSLGGDNVWPGVFQALSTAGIEDPLVQVPIGNPVTIEVAFHETLSPTLR